MFDLFLSMARKRKIEGFVASGRMMSYWVLIVMMMSSMASFDRRSPSDFSCARTTSVLAAAVISRSESDPAWPRTIPVALSTRAADRAPASSTRPCNDSVTFDISGSSLGTPTQISHASHTGARRPLGGLDVVWRRPALAETALPFLVCGLDVAVEGQLGRLRLLA